MNNQAHRGPRTASVSIMIPTIAAGVVLAPIVIRIKPNPSWKKPARKPKKISWGDIIILVDSKNPTKHEHTPATNWAGTMSTVGYFLIIIIKISKTIGIETAARLPDN